MATPRATPQNLFGPPPPDIDLSESRAEGVLAAAGTLMPIATIFVALRLLSRTKVQRIPLQADDWICVASLVPLWGYFVVVYYLTQNGLGRHIWAPSDEQLIHYFKAAFASGLVYFVALLVVKLAVIALYRRIFTMIKPLYVCVFLTIGFYIAATTTWLANCRPISRHWDQSVYPQLPGNCVINTYAFAIASAAINTAIDVVILLVPVRPVLKLHMRTPQKVLVLGVFFLGSFVCVASFLRLYYLLPFSHGIHNVTWYTSTNVTWYASTNIIWTIAEICLAVVCACLPTLRPLLHWTLQVLNTTIRSLLASFALRPRSGSSSGSGSAPLEPEARTKTGATAEPATIASSERWIPLE
ncbi:uncharacterized protein DSM5745_09456 [Aspergillus mulundensis]|uniref:Rhodopsin domain-containing protein n=1 Tax=Aspergillus mulundensis TaxID=1810919 RepID=A0A3D8QVB9_9EURO|nr:hypothetical protein DSM5745_09456 [Aspergillus mulundensis]RDW65717.1 hypothetical protein DSM5745_09456 [Aspergillus mulundensis]